MGESARVSAMAVALLEGVALPASTTLVSSSAGRSSTALIPSAGSSGAGSVMGEAAGVATVAVSLLERVASSSSSTGAALVSSTGSSGAGSIVGEAAGVSTVAISTLVGVAHVSSPASAGSSLKALLLGALAVTATGRKVVESLLGVESLVIGRVHERSLAVTALELHVFVAVLVLLGVVLDWGTGLRLVELGLLGDYLVDMVVGLLI